MFNDLRFSQNRKLALPDWARHHISTIKHDTLIEIVKFVLSDQGENGSWSHEGRKWGPVKTAVVLRGLSRLGFTIDDTWAFELNKSHIQGGVSAALGYLEGKLGSNPSTRVGEDIWDHCQVLLALAAFEDKPSRLEHAQWTIERWNSLSQDDPANQWTGPAFLAAIIDVAVTYQLTARVTEMVDALLARQQLIGNENEGMFRSVNNDWKMNLWNTALVLRTIASVSSISNDVIERTADWLIKAMATMASIDDDRANAPMFVARALEGLFLARNRVSRACADKIDQTLAEGNGRLEGYWQKCKSSEQEEGTFKAYTAVLEYLSALTIPVRFGVVTFAAAAVQKESELTGRPVDVSGGWRAVWLSDIHEASDVNVGWFHPKRWVRKFMYVSANRLTEFFQLQNLQAITARVKTLAPNHILVTGDLTNLATNAQFEKVKELFLDLQKALGGSDKQLSEALWTIIPGNHDVCRKSTKFENRKHLGRFFEHFSGLYADMDATRVKDPFPYENDKCPAGRQVKIRMICLDSNTHWPVWAIGPNAKGKIDAGQIDKLTRKLASISASEIVLVVLHHHPLTVPKIVSDWENYFLSLDPEDSRNLIAACAVHRVSAILHGHFHAYSDWSIPVGDRRSRMSVIGAPCGTMGPPGENVEFLELREAHGNTPSGVQIGLAVYSHRMSNQIWQNEPEYKTFLPSGLAD